MLRTVLASVVLLIASAPLVWAADPRLPTGTWSVAASKDALVISEVKSDGTVKAKLLGQEVTGTWKKGVLTLSDGKSGTIEARLLAEPQEKGKVKYTLTGTHTIFVTDFPVEPAIPARRVVGWYAQMTDTSAVPGEIKAEIRGVFVYEGHGKAYIDVKRQGVVADTRIWIYAAEHEWHNNKEKFTALNGKDVIATGQIAQTLKGTDANIPEGALMLLGKFEVKLANAPK
jgi:hypothetical protein